MLLQIVILKISRIGWIDQVKGLLGNVLILLGRRFVSTYHLAITKPPGIFLELQLLRTLAAEGSSTVGTVKQPVFTLYSDLSAHFPNIPRNVHT